MLELVSPAFGPGGPIPDRYALHSQSAKGLEPSIPYLWSGAPEATRSFALSLIDHAPVAREWVHWLVVGIPGTATGLPEGASRSLSLPTGARELLNSYGAPGYGGPMPPPGSGAHPYEATLYALDVDAIYLPTGSTLHDFERAVTAHVLEQASYVGMYER